MSSSNRIYLLAAAKQLKYFLQQPEHRGKPLDKVFIDWYIGARYGKEYRPKVVDGSGDGGIDAIVQESGTTVVLQSKYEVKPRISAVSDKELSAFEDIAQTIVDPKGDEAFAKWLGKVRNKTLRPHYRRLRAKALTNPESVRFDFITSKRVNQRTRRILNPIDIERVAHLWLLYQEGFTPPVESISIDFEDVWSTGHGKSEYRTYVGLADIRAILKLMDRDENERLFAQNIRTDLRSRVNDEIRATYEKHPRTFWLGNNGLYIVCGKAMLSGRTLELIYPSVINGSQTLHSIHSSNDRHYCEVLIRVLEMDIRGERVLLNEIIRRANNQNPMKAMNLVAHNHEQLNIGQYLDRFSIFYERREREWKNEKKMVMPKYLPVGLKEVAQWMAVTNTSPLLGTARSRLGTLFQGKTYQKLFSRFATPSQKMLGQLTRAVWAGLVVRHVIRRISVELRSQGKIVHLLLVRCVFEATSNTVCDRVENGLKQHAFRHPTKRTIRILKRIIKAYVAKQRTLQRKNEKLDLSNVFKRDDLTTAIYRKIVTRRLLEEFRRAIEPMMNS